MCCDSSTAPTEAPTDFEGKALSATEAFVWWHPLSQDSIDGYQVSGEKRNKTPQSSQMSGRRRTSLRPHPPQVKFWRNHEESEGGAQTVTASNVDTNTRLEGMKPNSNYLIEVRGYNTAGYGPPSERLQIHTKKARTRPRRSADEEPSSAFQINDVISSLASSKSSPQDHWEKV